MIERREFIGLLIGGLLYGKAASAFGAASDNDADALTRLLPRLIGVDKSDKGMFLRQGDINRRVAGDVAKVLAPYRGKDGFDADGLVRDLESGKLRLPKAVNSLFLSLRNRAAAAYYTSAEGRRAAGYEGPPLRGYPDYHECS